MTVSPTATVLQSTHEMQACMISYDIMQACTDTYGVTQHMCTWWFSCTHLCSLGRPEPIGRHGLRHRRGSCEVMVGAVGSD